MKGILKKLMQIGFAGALSLLAFAPSAVNAQEKSIQIEIPVRTEFSDDSDTLANTVKLTSTFKLEPLDGAPAPAEPKDISIDGTDKSKFGAITITEHGNYYYKLTGTVDNGPNSDATNVTRIVRIGVENDEEDGLRYRAQAYLSMEDAVGDKHAPMNPEDKPDTAFLITYREPQSPTPTPTPRDPKKAQKTKTSVYAQPGLWILIGGAALLILLGAGKRSKAR